MTFLSTTATEHRHFLIVPAVFIVLLAAWVAGRNASDILITVPIAAAATLAVFRQPRLGLLAIVIVALLFSRAIGTGTDVDLYPVALIVPGLACICMLAALLRVPFRIPPSPINVPLLLFLAAGLLSLAIGNLTWDPLVPRKSSFILVQFAQWAIFAFSAIALWLTGILADQEIWLKRMTACFLILGGIIGVHYAWSPSTPILSIIPTAVANRAPFWLLLFALAAGQLLYNRNLSRLVQLLLVLLLCAILYFALAIEREVASIWVGVVTVGGVLLWLRFPKLRVFLLMGGLLLLLSGALLPSLWSFAGGDDEWNVSGGSRFSLIERVIEVTLRNPITGLGPAAYRPYAGMAPLFYQGAYWIVPRINSHNNYVDLFSHVGFLGLAIFFWFVVAVGLVGARLRRRYTAGFRAGYVNSMLAAGVGSLVIMALADWILPFVYNISFFGFQASVLVWLFLGGLIALDNHENLPKVVSAVK